MFRKTAIILSLFGTLAACASQPVETISPAEMAARAAERHIAKGCSAEETAAQCEQRQRAEFAGLPVSSFPQPTAEAIYAEERRAMQIQAANRAMAECRYQGSMAYWAQPGIIPAFFSALGSASACEQYYRDIGVVR